MVTNRAQPKRQATLGAVVHDVTELLELQWQLIALNSREAKQSAISAVTMAVIGAGLFAVACLFTLGAVSLALYHYTDLAMWSSFAIVGVACLLLAALLGWLASNSLKHCTKAWDVSKQELRENLRWLKRSLVGQDVDQHGDGKQSNGTSYHPHFERQQ